MVVINTNTQSIFAQRALSINTLNLQRNIERLSTGFRINRAADDAAGLSISEKLTTRVQGYAKAKQNASDGISMAQTTEGSLGIVQENLQRIRELVVQGLNGTNSPKEVNAIQNEINERVQNIDDIATSTEFNGIQLLDGTTNRVLQTGSDAGQTTTLSFQSGVAAARGVDIDVSLVAAGTVTNDAGHLVEGLAAGASFSLDRIHLTLATVDSVAAINAADPTLNRDIVIGTPAATNEIDLSDLDTIIDNVSRMRSEIGAVQNTLESRITYLDIARENAEASRSRIKDVDVALESSALIKNQVLQQSAAAMLSQANQIPSIALQLLGG